MCEENLRGKPFFAIKRMVSPAFLSRKAIRWPRVFIEFAPCAPRRKRNDRPADSRRGMKGLRKRSKSNETGSARSSTVLRRLKKGSRSLSAKEQLPLIFPDIFCSIASRPISCSADTYIGLPAGACRYTRRKMRYRWPTSQVSVLRFSISTVRSGFLSSCTMASCGFSDRICVTVPSHT